MSSENESSSLSSSASTRCNIYIEELISTFSLTIDQQCLVCKHLVAYHARNSHGSATPISRSNDGSKSVLPQWGTDHKVVKTFLERFERVLTGDLVNESHWPRLLLKATPNSNDGYWVMKHIVDAKKNWNEAKKLFANHFGSYAYEQKLIVEYERIRQFKEESAQRYSDRFTQLTDQLVYNQDDPLVIQHYLNGLLPATYANLLRHMESASVFSNKEVLLVSFKEVSERVIRLDAIELNYGLKATSMNTRYNDSDNPQNNQSRNSSSNNNRSAQKSGEKQCSFHPSSNSHTTAECRYNPNKGAHHLPYHLPYHHPHHHPLRL